MAEKRGFAAMDPEKQREIARRGGRAAHEKGTAHEFSTDEAREAGRKGGIAVSADRQHMAQIGSEGGRRRGARKAAARQMAPAESQSDATLQRTEQPQANSEMT